MKHNITQKLQKPGLARRVIERSEPRTQTSRMLNCFTRRQATSIRSVRQLQGFTFLLPPLFPSALCLCADSLLPFVQLGSLERVCISRECYCFSELWGNYNKRERLLGFGVKWCERARLGARPGAFWPLEQTGREPGAFCLLRARLKKQLNSAQKRWNFALKLEFCADVSNWKSHIWIWMVGES